MAVDRCGCIPIALCQSRIWARIEGALSKCIESSSTAAAGNGEKKKRRVTAQPRSAYIIYIYIYIMMWQYFIKHTGTHDARKPRRLQRFAFISLDFSILLEITYSLSRSLFAYFNFIYLFRMYTALENVNNNLTLMLCNYISKVICDNHTS